MPGKNADFGPSPQSNIDDNVGNVSFESHHPIPADIHSPDRLDCHTSNVVDPSSNTIESTTLNNLLEFNEPPHYNAGNIVKDGGS